MQTVGAAGAVLMMALLAMPLVRASVTNVVDVAALLAVADNGATTATNGWTLASIGSYADPVLQFNSKDDWIVSEDFGAPILRMEFGVRCTANTARRLAVLNESTGGQVRELALCAKGNADETQALDFAPEEALTRFRLKMNAPSGSSGNWGVRSLAVVVAEPAVAPSNLRVARAGDGWCGLAWENGAGTVSNRVDTFLVARGAGEEVVFQTGFDGFDALGKGNPVPSADRLSEIDPALSGVNVYAPTNTSGICQIGTGRDLGFLRYDGIGDYSNVVLRLRAKRYPGDNAETTVVSVDSSGTTNEVETIVLGNDYADYEIALSSVTNAGSALLLGYYATKSNRRVLIDSLSLVRTGADTLTPVDSRWIPAAPGAASFSTRGVLDLPATAACRFEVGALNADGLVSGTAEVAVQLGDASGACLMLR